MSEDLYAHWRAALAGEKPPIFVDDPKCGFFKKGVYARGITRKGVFTPQEGSHAKRIGWAPVAIFMDVGGVMVGRVGNDEFYGDALNDIWNSVAGSPISEETYRAIAERTDQEDMG